MKRKKIGEIDPAVKIAAGLFWADYGELGAQVEELTQAGVDWIHIEMRDVEQFVRAGMTVGEFSSPLFKGSEGRYKAGTGEIGRAVKRLRSALDRASRLQS